MLTPALVLVKDLVPAAAAEVVSAQVAAAVSALALEQALEPGLEPAVVPGPVLAAERAAAVDSARAPVVVGASRCPTYWACLATAKR